MITPRSVLAAVFALAISPGLASAASSSWEAKLTKVSGTVETRAKGAAEDAWTAAAEGTLLNDGDTIRTGAGSRAEVTFDLDSVVELQPQANFTVQSLKKSDTWLRVNLGMLLGKFKKLASGSSLRFRTPTAVAAIRGTELAVYSEGGEGPARFGVFDEGKVEVSAEGKGSVTLDPNHETTVKPGEGPGAPEALKFFKFAQARIKTLRERQKYFGNRFRQKYRVPRRRK